MPKINFTHVGQAGPYRDSIYAGTIEANSEREARKVLAANRGVKVINDEQTVNWWEPYFREFKLIRPGVWKFSIVEAFTD